MNQLLKTIIGIVMILSTLLLGACSDEPDPKQIYGTYEGSTHALATTISSSEITADYTLASSLSITKSDKGMSILITGNNFEYEITGLPILNVTGNSNYKYTYKDDTTEMSISSADYNIISATIIQIDMENDIRYDISFSGRRD